MSQAPAAIRHPSKELPSVTATPSITNTTTTTTATTTTAAVMPTATISKTVTLVRPSDVSTFGLDFICAHGQEDGILTRVVGMDGIAAEAGVESNARIISINGTICRGMSADALREVLESAGETMVIELCDAPTPTTDTSLGNVLDVAVTPGSVPMAASSDDASAEPNYQTMEVSLSCIREFLHRKKLITTLAALDEESPRDANTISSRKDLVKILAIFKIVQTFLKTGATASLLEIVANHWIMSSSKHGTRAESLAAADVTMQVSLSCIREFLHRNKLVATLTALDEESPRDANTISSRKDLVKILNIFKIVKKFLKVTRNTCSLLEIIADHWISQGTKKDKRAKKAKASADGRITRADPAV